MKTDLFLILLLLSSILISLITEAVKKMISNFASNGVAAITSLFVGGGIGITYCYLDKRSFDFVSVAIVVAIIIGSWLCAMLGYDKIKQAILQFKLPDATEGGTTLINSINPKEVEALRTSFGLPVTTNDITPIINKADATQEPILCERYSKDGLLACTNCPEPEEVLCAGHLTAGKKE